jgi:hypothetical protein
MISQEKLEFSKKINKNKKRIDKLDKMLKQKDLDVSQINYILNKKSKIEMRIKEYTEFLVDQCNADARPLCENKPSKKPFVEKYTGWDKEDWVFFVLITFPFYFFLIQWILRK